MRTHWFGQAGAAIALTLGLSSGVPLASSQEDASQGEIGVQTKAALTAEQQVAQAQVIHKRAQQLATRLTKMLDEARREKDIMRANCLNRKLTEVNANVRNVEQRAKALDDAAAGNDAGRRNHEFTVLSVLSQKLDQLDREAAQCLGQSVYEPGASQVITTIPADGPSGDPTFVEPPPSAPPPVFTVPPPVQVLSPTAPED